MKPQILLPILGILILFVSHVELQDKFCQPVTQNINPNEFPELPQEFQTRIEINIIDNNLSMEVLVLYDRWDKNGEFTFREKNDRYIQRLKFRDNELFSIRRSGCEVKKINESANMNLFFGMMDNEDGTPGINMRPPTYLFHFNNGFPHERDSTQIGRASCRERV